MKKHKKILLGTLGAAILIATPIAFTVSCGSNSDANAEKVVPIPPSTDWSDLVPADTPHASTVLDENNYRELSSFDKTDGTLTIDKEVTSIADTVFKDGYPIGDGHILEIHHLVLQEGLTLIADNAFQASSNFLKSIIIPDSVITIGNGAFENADELTSLQLGSQLVTIGDNAFKDASQITTLNIPDSVTTIGNGAFENADELTSLQLGSRLVTIGDNAFKDASQITTLNIPDSVTTIGDSAFESATSISDFALGKGVMSVGNRAFLHLYGTKLILHDGIENIGQEAFSNLKLTSLYVPASVVDIGAMAFEYSDLSSALQFLGDPETTTLSVGANAFSFSEITDITGPNGDAWQAWFVINSPDAFVKL